MNAMELSDKKILVTGGRGFFGSAVMRALVARGVPVGHIATPSSKEADLRIKERCESAVKGQDVVIHLAAFVGGIGANAEHPGAFFYENALMGIQLMEAARLAGVKKFVTIGTICEYPANPPIPFREETIWDGYPMLVTAPYGLAKKMLLVQGQAYRKEYGFNSIHLLPTNLYGPGDNFDPSNSHVVPALIKKVVDAKKTGAPLVELFGTGKATRDFLYIDDAAQGVTQALEQYEGDAPVNLGSGREIAIRELLDLIIGIVGFIGEVRYDTSKPDGQPRRKLDISRAQKEFGFDPAMPFEEGLRKTIDWYISRSVS